MSISDCCKLVGNFFIDKPGVISLSTNSSTEVSKLADKVVIGPTIGSITITAYAKNEVHIGCAGEARVDIPWVRKYDCDNDKVHFIFNGAGSSSIYGDVEGLAEILIPATNYTVLNASASSGPANIYSDYTQYDGYGLKYVGDPWPFEANDDGIRIDIGVSYGTELPPLYLQNFILQLQPGQVPTAIYTLVFAVNSNQ